MSWTPGTTYPHAPQSAYAAFVSVGAVEARYEYDPVANSLAMTTGSETGYTYDRADRIQSAGTTSYTVDANGNLTNRGSDTFAYDQANRLKTATIGGAASSYSYDGDGRRSSKTVGGQTTGFVYDVNAGLPVVLDDGTLRYVWGAGLAYAVGSSGSLLVYHTDGLGSVRAITDASGSVVQTYSTDEFGVPTQSQGSVSQPFGYTGEQRDAESSLVYLRARMYDPAIGRFLQRDPVAGTTASPLTLNRYTQPLYIRPEQPYQRRRPERAQQLEGGRGHLL